MKNILAFISFSILFICFSGCTSSPQNNLNSSISSKINIAISESITKSGRSVILTCTTDSVYACSNYGINTSIQKENNSTVIKFNEITTPSVCATAFAPASTEINLGYLNNGNYSFQFLANGEVFQTSIIVNDNYFKVSNQTGNWIDLKTPLVLRVPVNTIWGYIGFYADTLKSEANMFLDSLKALGAKNFNFLPGNYTLFQIDSTGALLPPEGNTYKNTVPYIYIYNGNIDSAKALVKYYGQHSQISMSLLTDKGDAFYSWVLATEP